MTTSSVAQHFVGVQGGLVMSLIAFSIVFIVIMGLMFIMMGMKHVCNVIDGVKTKAPLGAPAAPAAPTAKTSAAVAVAEDDGVLLAVISAAIASMCGSAAKVVSFAPVKAPAKSSWRFLGKIQNAEGFQD
ncbi:MAG: OadG family protein [Synergistaceae bacterium]|nr:OadG family protein [Synergistaceae bacterium]